MLKRISIILNVSLIICIFSLTYMFTTNGNKDNKCDCVFSENKTNTNLKNIYTCTKQIYSADNYNIYIKEIVNGNNYNAITDLNAYKVYEIINDDGYNHVLSIDSECIDDYKKDKTIKCSIDVSQSKESYLGHWTQTIVSQLEEDGFKCNY